MIQLLSTDLEVGVPSKNDFWNVDMSDFRPERSALPIMYIFLGFVVTYSSYNFALFNEVRMSG